MTLRALCCIEQVRREREKTVKSWIEWKEDEREDVFEWAQREKCDSKEERKKNVKWKRKKQHVEMTWRRAEGPAEREIDERQMLHFFSLRLFSFFSFPFFAFCSWMWVSDCMWELRIHVLTTTYYMLNFFFFRFHLCPAHSFRFIFFAFNKTFAIFFPTRV